MPVSTTVIQFSGSSGSTACTSPFTEPIKSPLNQEPSMPSPSLVTVPLLNTLTLSGSSVSGSAPSAQMSPTRSPHTVPVNLASTPSVPACSTIVPFSAFRSPANHALPSCVLPSVIVPTCKICSWLPALSCEYKSPANHASVPSSPLSRTLLTPSSAIMSPWYVALPAYASCVTHAASPV